MHTSPRMRLRIPTAPLVRMPRVPSLSRWYRHRRSLEQIVVYDDDREQVWRAELLFSELMSNFDRRARYVRRDWAPEIIGTLLCGGFGWLIGYSFWFWWIPVPLFDIIMGAGPAFLLGVLGWWIGPLFGPRAHWFARRRGGVLVPILHGREISPPESDNEPDPKWSPSMAQVLEADYRRTAFEGVEVLTAGVMHEIMEMRDEREMVTGGMSRWQKIALGGVLTLLGSMVVALFFFAAVLTEGA